MTNRHVTESRVSTHWRIF